MIYILNQNKTNVYYIYSYYLKYNEEGECYELRGIARPSLKDIEFVILGVYKFYKQATEVFSKIDYENNDLMYYKKNKKYIELPENIIDERECISIYGSIY